jgi:MFS family permease
MTSGRLELMQDVPDPRRWWALALLCGAFFMVLLDGTIVIVALPSIGADLGFSEQGQQWVLSAYALTFGGLLLLGGRTADLLGRRRAFTVGVLFFTVASLLCGLAWSPAALLAARVVQGVGAAIMTPTALSIISTTFPEGAERNRALGIWRALGGVGATAAWLIGARTSICVASLHRVRRTHWSRERGPGTSATRGREPVCFTARCGGETRSLDGTPTRKELLMNSSSTRR